MVKFQNVPDCRAAEGIDALVIVPDNADVALASGQLFDQCALRRVGVLILVHKDIVELTPVFLQHLGTCIEQHRSIKYQIVKVQRGKLLKLFLIRVVDLTDMLFPHVVRAELGQIARR